MTWLSLSPAVRRSRTSTRKSFASGASESSIDWFWHTMQRSSWLSARARDSSAGSFRISSGWTAKAGTLSESASATTRRRRTALLRRLQRGFPRGLRRTDTQPPVGKRQRATEHHDNAAEPDQQHQRLVIEPDRDRAVGGDIAERQIKLRRAARQQRGFCCGHLALRECALGRLEHVDNFPVAPHGKARDQLAVVRSLARGHSIEREIIAANRNALAWLERHDAFGIPLALGDDSEQQHASGEMRHGRAPRGARQTASARECNDERLPEQS